MTKKIRIVADMRIIESMKPEVGTVTTTSERVYRRVNPRDHEPLDRVVNLFEQRTPQLSPWRHEGKHIEYVEVLYVVRLAINNKYVEEKAFENYDDAYNHMVLLAHPEDIATEH